MKPSAGTLALTLALLSAGATPGGAAQAAAAQPTAREAQLTQLTASDPGNAKQWAELAHLQEQRGARADAERTLTAALAATGRDRGVLLHAGMFFARGEQFDKAIGLFEEMAERQPEDPQGYQLLAAFYYDKAAKDQRLAATDRARYVDAGIMAADRAIALNNAYVEAIVYKSILLRLKAKDEPDAVQRDAMTADADQLRSHALELRKTQRAWKAPGLPILFMPAPPPPPPPPATAPSATNTSDLGGLQPVRVGGNIPTPTKITDARPHYPEEAIKARVSGMVVLEAIIAPDGSVHSAKVLRSIPLLDEPAIEAVKQWRYEPTYLNGVAVPVIMTVTVNFSLR